ncbi:MAG: hypothetical protein JXB25_10765 [Deltaproteobacteria bacterium]|nr:hypothetical protein [Deltaproteobacteria bacterium]
MTSQTAVPRPSLATALVLLFLAVAVPVQAHRVNIFAWVEGETIHTESKFSGGKMVQGGEVVVLDPQGKVLLRGKTDDQGAFSFPVPARTDLKLVLNATMGHRAEWTLTAAELAPAAAVTEPAPAAESEPAPAVTAPPPPPAIPAAELERIIDAALERRLQPIRHALAELKEEKVGFREVMGGLGYIFGLMGVAAYFRYRK